MNFYRQFGFADARCQLKDASRKAYAVPSLNFITMEQLNAIADALLARRSPVILMVAPKHCRQFETQMIVRMAQAMVERVRAAGCGCPISLHLDHGTCFEECMDAIDHGFSSVMIDGSGLPLEENIRLTRRVVDYARLFDVAVEGEVGALSGCEDGDEGEAGQQRYTDPAQARRFVEETGVDSLAVSVGTVHGLNKSSGGDHTVFSGLRYDLIDEISALLPEFPLVLHGCSSLPAKYVDMINHYSGKMEPMVGVPDECLEKVSKTAVCKINIASDGWIPSTAITRKVLAEHPDLVDSRLYRKEIREELTGIYCHKMDLFGSTGKGWAVSVSDNAFIFG